MAIRTVGTNMVAKEYITHTNDLKNLVSWSSFENISSISKYLLLRKKNTPLNTEEIKPSNNG